MMTEIIRSDPIIITGAGHSGTRGLVDVLCEASCAYFGDLKHHKNEWEFYRLLSERVNAQLLGLPEGHDHNIIPADLYRHLRITSDQIEYLSEYIRTEILKNPEQSLPPKNVNIWVIKTPRMALCLEIWHHVFPNARFVNLIRDGRDVAYSLPLESGSLMRRFELWRARVYRMEWYKKRYLPIIDFRYEDLMEPEKLKDLCDQLNIDYIPNMQEKVKMSTGRGISAMKGMPYERFELIRYGYPVNSINFRKVPKISRFFHQLFKHLPVYK